MEETKQQINVSQEQLLQLLEVCYTYIRDNGLLEDFSDYTGMPISKDMEGYTGNIDINNRRTIENPDGSVSTERSITIEEDGDFVNIPTIVDGVETSEEDAINAYHRTGQHLGKFKSRDEAVSNAVKLHQRQEKHYAK